VYSYVLDSQLQRVLACRRESLLLYAPAFTGTHCNLPQRVAGWVCLLI